MATFLLMTLLVLPATKPAAPDPALMKNAMLLALMKSLHELTPQKMSDEKLHKHIRQMIKPLDANDVGRLALLAFDIKTGLAEDDQIDMVYWRAWWVCTERIAERNDEESVWLMEHLARRANVSGSELRRMKELMDKQRALPRSKEKR